MAAIVIEALPFTAAGDTTGATTSTDDATACAHSRNTIWYRFQAPREGTVEVRTAGSTFDTTLAVLRGTSQIACNDDADGRHAAVRFTSESGRHYAIQVGGYEGETGLARLTVDWVDSPPKPDPQFAAEPGTARIRPGVRIGLAGSGCTANFVFVGRGVLEGRAYLGTAAHCVQDLDVGREAWVSRDAHGEYGRERIGVVAYTSFKQLDLELEPCFGPYWCVHPRHIFDFAFVELDPRMVAQTSASMLGYGGPTAIAARADMAAGDRLLTFGNSSVRDTSAVASWDHRPLVPPVVEAWTAEGYLLNRGQENGDAAAWFVPHRIPGDSGSPIITWDGRAAGIVRTIQGIVQDGVPGANGFTLVETVVREAAREGFQVDLVTAPQLDDGLLPDLR